MNFKIHSLLLNLSFLCLTVLSVKECSSYTCKTSQMNFDDETCIYYDQVEDVYYSKECSGNNICNTPYGYNITCSSSQYFFGLGGPGEKCTQDIDCGTTNGCANGICQGTSAGQICSSFTSCMPGNTCVNLKCAPQTEIGQKGCLSDYDCVNNGACQIISQTNREENTCYLAFSFGPHVPVGNCINGESLLCKYLNCAQNGTSNDYYCTNLMTSLDDFASPCMTSTNECPSKPDNFFEPAFIANSVCECGYNIDRNSYCSLFYGDGPGLKYLSYMASWYSSPGILKCNTWNRDSFHCMMNYWDEKSFQELYYWYTYFIAYNLIVGSEKCVMETVTYQYAYAAKLNGITDLDDSAIVLGISMMIGFIFS